MNPDGNHAQTAGNYGKERLAGAFFVFPSDADATSYQKYNIFTHGIVKILMLTCSFSPGTLQSTDHA